MRRRARRRGTRSARRRDRCRARSAPVGAFARQRITISDSAAGTRELTSTGAHRRFVHLLVAHGERVGAVERRKADERLVQA